MDGLIVLGIIALYFMVLIGSAVAGYKIAARRGLTNGKRWLGAAIGFGVIFLPVFWDVIPTFWLHQHYCETEGGVTVYKTFAQWQIENKGKPQSQRGQAESKNLSTVSPRQWVTPRIYSQTSQNPHFAHAIGREEELLVDAVTSEILARSVNFWRGQHWNLISSGGTLDDFRQLLVLSWGHRFCGDAGASPMDKMRELKVNILSMERSE